MAGTVKKSAKKAVKAARTLNKVDRKATRKAATFRRTLPARAAGLLAEVADQPQLVAAALATIGAGVVTRRGDLVRGGARMLAAHLAATAVKNAIKQRVDRSRPAHELAGNPATLRRGGSDDHDLTSFPSGHTAGAVAATQPATGSHHLSDVVVGGLIGLVAEGLVTAIFDRIEPAVERALDRHGVGAAVTG